MKFLFSIVILIHPDTAICHLFAVLSLPFHSRTKKHKVLEPQVRIQIEQIPNAHKQPTTNQNTFQVILILILILLLHCNNEYSMTRFLGIAYRTTNKYKENTQTK